ncbi:MAG TPA: NAD(P)/FAD-dependent oxidoreductase [Candidatus Thermoplasmatota archaeon]|jgi:digeranylgeranylglycerophospholipid reductase|nr:NAD(P)/FAD-dependent oxidoreductase [Candidatus Thermoplasmatota archaeon]
MRRVEVVGGSVAGLSAAWEFLERGWGVRVWEDDRDPARFDACGEAWTEPQLCPLPKDPEHGFAGKLEGFMLHSWPAPGAHVTARLPAREAYISYRGQVQRSWAEMLAKRGAELRFGQRVRVADLDALQGELVVDATGWPSLSAQRFGFLKEFRAPLLAFYANVPLADARFPVGWLHAVVPSHFNPYSGYTWIFPRPDGIANVGVGWDPLDPRAPPGHRAALAATEELLDLDTTRWVGGNIPLWRGLDLAHALHRLPSGVPVAAVGDAIGAVGPLTGDGMGPAMETARLLADCALAGRLEDYPAVLARHFAGRDRAHWRLRSYWDGVQDVRLFARVVQALDGLPFEALDRDPNAAARRLLRHPGLAVRMAMARPMARGGWAR